jgi:hypothetical protein
MTIQRRSSSQRAAVLVSLVGIAVAIATPPPCLAARYSDPLPCDSPHSCCCPTAAQLMTCCCQRKQQPPASPASGGADATQLIKSMPWLPTESRRLIDDLRVSAAIAATVAVHALCKRPVQSLFCVWRD